DRRGDHEPALDLARAVRRGRPHGLADRRARRLTERIREAHPDVFGGAEAEAGEAEMRLGEGDLAGARAVAAAVLDSAPTAPIRARALWVRAQAEHALAAPRRPRPRASPSPRRRASRWRPARWRPPRAGGGTRTRTSRRCGSSTTPCVAFPAAPQQPRRYTRSAAFIRRRNATAQRTRPTSSSPPAIRARRSPPRPAGGRDGCATWPVTSWAPRAGSSGSPRAAPAARASPP